MTTATLAMLDQAELLQLAINASGADDAGSAIAYLKEAVSRADGNATAHYLLGAEYAQSRLYERAIDQMEAALAIDPALSVARLQLGLLWLGAANAERAAGVLAPLAELAAADPLHHFGLGLLHLIENRTLEARASLAAGLPLNVSNPALNGDMQKVIGEIDKLLAGAAGQAPEAETEAPEQGGRNIFLSAYTGNGQS